MVGCTILGRAVQKPSTFLFQSSPHLQAIFRLKLAQRYIPQDNSLMEAMLFLVSFGEGRGQGWSLVAHIPGACRAGSVSAGSVSVHSLHTPGRQEAVEHQLHQGSQASRLL